MIDLVPNWHPIFVHFTVALFSVAVILMLVVQVLGEGSLRGQLLIVARWNLWLGAIFSIATLIAGWLAYNTVAHDTPSHEAMTVHRNWALVTSALFLPLALWSGWTYRQNRNTGPVFLLLMVVALGLLAATSWRGGEIVYRYGLGVMSLPQSEGDDGHEHEEGDAHAEPSITRSDPAPQPPAAPAVETGSVAQPPVTPAVDTGSEPVRKKSPAKGHVDDGHTH